MLTPKQLLSLAAPVGFLAFAAGPSAMAANIAQDWQSVEQITQNVAQALGRVAAPIDRRIKLAKCPEMPVVTATDSNSLAVRCPSLGWRLRVGMNAAAGADSAPSYFAPTAQMTKERAAAPDIRRGDVVRISIDTPNYSVSYPATATQDARVGETIALRGADPKNHIMATVIAPGRAQIAR
jgi:flagella basal body P-ring formation protein FlgA